MSAPTERTTVHLIRHGQVHNPESVLYGRLPGYRLSALGLEMAETVASALAGRDIVYLAASPLERAQQTAAPIAGALGLPVHTDDRLIEAASVFEGKRVSVGDGALRDPRSWWSLRNPFQPSWGEPYQQIAERMFAAVQAIRDASAGHEGACVSHQSPIFVTRRFAQGRRMWHNPGRRGCSLASVTSITFAGEKVVEVSYTEPAAALLDRVGEPSAPAGA